jgi:predicted methyltransferase
MSPNVENHSVSGPTLPSEINSRNRSEMTKLDNCQKVDTMEQLVLYVYEDKLVKNPQIEIMFSDKCKAIAILDTGSDVNLLSKRVYIKLVKAGIDVPTLLLEGVVLITVFCKLSSKVETGHGQVYYR